MKIKSSIAVVVMLMALTVPVAHASEAIYVQPYVNGRITQMAGVGQSPYVVAVAHELIERGKYAQTGLTLDSQYVLATFDVYSAWMATHGKSHNAITTAQWLGVSEPTNQELEDSANALKEAGAMLDMRDWK